jgi:hypothetical protein
VAPFGTVDWVKNARESGEVTLSRPGESCKYRLHEVEAAHRAPILKRYLEVDPFSGARLGVKPNAPVEAFEAISNAHPVFFLVRRDPCGEEARQDLADEL